MRPAACLLALAATATLVTGAACAAAGTPPTAPDPPRVDLPADWADRSAYAFERWLDAKLPAGAVTPLTAGARATATAALPEQSPRALRAALVLARSRTPEARDALIEQLEARREAPERAGDAADVIAAAALARFPAAGELRDRLERLAVGPEPHPDLEVRVECARAALALGSDAPIPFLLQVVRITTPAGEADARDFEVGPTTTWARTQAAIALSRRAGVPTTYRADGPLAHREEEARRLAELLGD